jgi:rod shape-determining protein MreC
MRSLLNFLLNFHFIILFLLLECFSFFLLVQYNDYQKAAFLNSSNNVSGRVYKTMFNMTQYLGLKEKNRELIDAIAKNRNYSKSAYKYNQISLIDVLDSNYIQQYKYIPTVVINNSVNKQNNYLTLNVGKNQGVDKGMAVVSPMGIVGVVKESSKNFSSVISLLNQNLRISAMIKRNGYFGSVNWDGTNYQRVILSDLPSHISIRNGDTVITSGYSTMFPKGELIGVVDEVEKSERGEFLEVKVKLSVDFKSISNVIVIRNLLQEEQLMLEKESSHD